MISAVTQSFDRKGNAAVLLAGLALLVVAILCAASLGEMPVSISTVIKALANGTGAGHFAVAPIDMGVIWDYRLARAIMAAVSGAGLAVCGTVLQALLRNALAEPYVLGVSAGASTGAVAVMLLGIGGASLGVPLGAFMGAVAAFALVMVLSQGGAAGNVRVILAGVASAQLFNALTSWLVATSANAEQTRGIMFWMMGSLAGVRWPDVGLATLVVGVALLCCLQFTRALDGLAFGEQQARSLGLSVGRIRAVLLLITALVTAALVSQLGAIGFVGLVVPHAMRFLVGPLHGRLLPLAAVFGANFLVWCDIVARLIVPHQVLPIGVVTALIGAPAFAIILYRARGQQ
ncbi:Fe(3+) dicitrate transport system permease protein FecD [Carnimonas sp. R-84981]|uniref:FecCD family ABC transporter permease n=1 Tax=Carnimonas bestiolae TaxID=3402172 RepID=UPI003EDC84A1